MQKLSVSMELGTNKTVAVGEISVEVSAKLCRSGRKLKYHGPVRHIQSSFPSLCVWLDASEVYSKRKGNILLTFVFSDDKKELGAARRSQYYMKYGNPNYGGMKGILSNSWWVQDGGIGTLQILRQGGA